MSRHSLTASLLCAVLGCVSCVEINQSLGGGLVPQENQYQSFLLDIPIPKIESSIADGLSGFSTKRISIGAVQDSEYGLSTRSCALTLVPLADTLDFGNIQSVKSFIFHASFDTVSVSSAQNERILQEVEVYELKEKTAELSNSNRDVAHADRNIAKNRPVIDGNKDLDFYFSDEFALDFVNRLNKTVINKSFDDYFSKFPGIYIKTANPMGNEGRFNSFDVQLRYTATSAVLNANYASLTISSIYPDSKEAKDTTFFFCYGLQNYTNRDSLFTYGTQGAMPQYAYNVTGHQTSGLAGEAKDKIFFEGGAGLKPLVKARDLRDAVKEQIMVKMEELGLTEKDLENVTINKAAMVLPYEDNLTDWSVLDYFPARMSPTTKITNTTDEKTTTVFMNLTDYSSSSENQGDINRSLCCYEPDITYHLQEILTLEDEKFDTGNYDIWLMSMAEETTTTTSGSSSSSNDMSEYYQYLMYQNYYNNMYSGGYGYNSYNSYYNYMLASMYANQSQSTTSTNKTYELDAYRFYKGTLCGPTSGRAPHLAVTFSVHK